jgi:hypothetical protein
VNLCQNRIVPRGEDWKGARRQRSVQKRSGDECHSVCTGQKGKGFSHLLESRSHAMPISRGRATESQAPAF